MKHAQFSTYVFMKDPYLRTRWYEKIDFQPTDSEYDSEVADSVESGSLENTSKREETLEEPLT